jgi:hypothetical protein
MNRFILLLILFCLSAASTATPPNPKEVTVEIVSAEFGLFDASNPDELAFEPATVVPQKVGQRYGWVIEVRTRKRSLAVREEYLLPTAATAAAPSFTAKIAADPTTLNVPLLRRNQVSQRQLVPVEGRIFGEWSIGPGEPAGQRHLQVIIEGQLGADFEYEVR